jgi:nucleotide-binding universal stress UspA family protein
MAPIPRRHCVSAEHLSLEMHVGKVVDGIRQVVAKIAASLICMATVGRDGIIDVLRGSTTEWVLREVQCPVLAVPII